MITIYLITGLFAALSAFLEAEWRWMRIMDGDRRELPHGLLLSLRIVAGVFIVLAAHAPWWAIIGMAGVFAPIHRLVFNLRSGKTWDYLGSAVYDRFWTWAGGGWRPYYFEALVAWVVCGMAL
jgi:hypothetical protein